MSKIELPLDQNCFVTSITLVMLKKFGFDALEWDPLIVRDAFEGGFGVSQMPQRMFDKLNCGLSLLGTSLYTDTIEGFLTGTACMSNLSLDGTTVPFVTFRQCAWGVWEHMNLNGEMDKSMRPTAKFCPDILEYIRRAAALTGISLMPDWLSFVGLDESKLPDMIGDSNLFEMYMTRQREYIDDMNVYVVKRQDALGTELHRLAELGLVAEKA